MSKMKDLYFEMFETALEFFQHGYDRNDVRSVLVSNFGCYDMSWINQALFDAENDINSYHRDMMHSVYSYEEQYERT